MAHEAFEAALDNAGVRLGSLVTGSDTLTPIVHTEADYSAPIRLSDRLTVEVSVGRIGDTSFAIEYRFLRDTTPAATAKTVHVAIDRSSGRKKNLPDELRGVLGKI